MGLLTAIKAIGTVAGLVGSAKSRPKKGEVEKFSPFEASNILIGKERIKRFGIARDRMTKLAKEHMNSPGVKSILAGKQRADIAQASAELSYANVANPSQAAMETQAEGELAGDLAGKATEFDLNKSLEYVNMLAGQEGVMSSSRTQLAGAESEADRTSYLAKLDRTSDRWGFVSGAAMYGSSFLEDDNDKAKEYNRNRDGRGYGA